MRIRPIIDATVAVILSTALVFSGGAAATAAEPSAPVSHSTMSPEQTASLEALLSANDSSTRTFTVAHATTAGAAPQDVADFSAMLKLSGWTVVGETVAAPSIAAAEVVTTFASCTGNRGYTGFYGWGWQWALNSCDTDLLIQALLAGGGGTAAVGGVLTAVGIAPAGGITAAVGALIAAGAGPIQVCKTASYGAHAIYLNVFATGSIGCWGQ